MWQEIESIRSSIQTSITKAQYLSLTEALSVCDFSDANYYYLSGTDTQGQDHDRVVLNPEQNIETILDLFYLADEE